MRLRAAFRVLFTSPVWLAKWVVGLLACVLLIGCEVQMQRKVEVKRDPTAPIGSAANPEQIAPPVEKKEADPSMPPEQTGPLGWQGRVPLREVRMMDSGFEAVWVTHDLPRESGSERKSGEYRDIFDSLENWPDAKDTLQRAISAERETARLYAKEIKISSLDDLYVSKLGDMLTLCSQFERHWKQAKALCRMYNYCRKNTPPRLEDK
jgi:hypothetical protein